MPNGFVIGSSNVEIEAKNSNQRIADILGVCDYDIA